MAGAQQTKVPVLDYRREKVSFLAWVGGQKKVIAGVLVAIALGYFSVRLYSLWAVLDAQRRCMKLDFDSSHVVVELVRGDTTSNDASTAFHIIRCQSRPECLASFDELSHTWDFDRQASRIHEPDGETPTLYLHSVTLASGRCVLLRVGVRVPSMNPAFAVEAAEVGTLFRSPRRIPITSTVSWKERFARWSMPCNTLRFFPGKRTTADDSVFVFRYEVDGASGGFVCRLEELGMPEQGLRLVMSEVRSE